MNNLNRFIAAVAHITDFPLELSEYGSLQGEPYQVYTYKERTLIGSTTLGGYLITVSTGSDKVSKGDKVLYELRVYGNKAIYHDTLKRGIKLDKTGQWETYSGDTRGQVFSNLYDAMMHCGGTHGWI